MPSPQNAMPGPAQAPAPLQGTVVLDLTRWLSGPYAGMMLADAGATVIKVEPREGEVTRTLQPRLKDADGSDVGGYFLRLNRGKKSVTLDLATRQGQEQFRKLAATADVLMENYRPGVMAARGLDYETLARINPRLVYCSISGFGQTPGPWRDWPAFNAVAEVATAAVDYDETGRPRRRGGGTGDLIAGMQAFANIGLALLRRASTGKGSFLDVSMFDCMASFNEMVIAWPGMTGGDYKDGATRNLNIAPYDLFPCKDGYVCIGVATDDQWRKFCKVTGLARLGDDPRLVKGSGRVAHSDEIRNVIEEWLASRVRHEVAELLAGADVPSAPVLTGGEVLQTGQAKARGLSWDVQAPRGKSWVVPAYPVRFTPPWPVGVHRVPAVGEDNGRYLVGLDE